MVKIRRGTTPTIEINIPDTISLDTVEALYVSVSQKNGIVIEKKLSDVVIEGQKISLNLTQNDTLRLNPNANGDIQLRFVLASGRAFGSQIESVKVLDVLKKGEI